MLDFESFLLEMKDKFSKLMFEELNKEKRTADIRTPSNQNKNDYMNSDLFTNKDKCGPSLNDDAQNDEKEVLNIAESLLRDLHDSQPFELSHKNGNGGSFEIVEEQFDSNPIVNSVQEQCSNPFIYDKDQIGFETVHDDLQDESKRNYGNNNEVKQGVESEEEEISKENNMHDETDNDTQLNK